VTHASSQFGIALNALGSPLEPDFACNHCPRLVSFLEEQRKACPDWWNGPVPTWFSDANQVSLLIVGLAPGLKGANRTGVPFTGDASGDLLFATLEKFGFATGAKAKSNPQNITLHKTAITNALRCVPPHNKPTASEASNCRPFLVSTIERFHNLQTIITLGITAHQSTLRALEVPQKDATFGHGVSYELIRSSNTPISIISSYHCSRYNVNTKRLTVEMFEEIFRLAKSRT
jgi:uracil-DNA glycosylase family 4